MMMSPRHWPTSTRIAGAALLAALALDVAAYVRVRAPEAGSPVTAVAASRPTEYVVNVRDDAEVMRDALGRTPFDVTAPASAVSYAVVQQSSPSPTRPRLIGTVQEGRDGGFVMVERADGQTQLVRIGERTGELRLRAVSAGVALFEDAQGSRVTLKTPTAGLDTRP